MGWPTTQKLATILGRPVVEPRLTKSAHQQIGNAMHVFNAGLIVMSVLGSIELIDIGVPKVLCLQRVLHVQFECLTIEPTDVNTMGFQPN